MVEKIEAIFGIHKVKSQLLFWFFLLLLLLLLLTVIPYYWIESHERKNATINELHKQVQLEGTHIEHWMLEREQDIEMLASITSTLSITQSNNSLWVYRNLLFGNDAFDSIARTDENGKVLLSLKKNQNQQINYNFNKTISVRELDYFQAAKRGATYISSVNQQDGKGLFVISTPIWSKGEVSGVLYANVKVDSIQLLFGDTSQAPTYMVNKNGQILSPSEQHMDGKIRSHIFTQALQNKPINHSYENQNNQHVFGSYKWINNNNWLIISEKTKSEVFSSLYIQLFIFCLNILVVFTIGFLLFMGIAERINQPLHLLTKSAINIRFGNWHTLDNHVFKRSGNEFNELAHSFNSMVKQLKRNVISIRKTQQQYKSVVDHVKEVVYQIDLNGKWIFLNPAWETISGYSIDEALGKDFMSFIHRDDQHKMHKVLAPIRNREVDFVTSKVRYRQKDGGEKIVEFYCTALFDENDQLECYTGAIHDITEWVHAEQKLQIANKKLEEMSYVDSLTKVPNRRYLERNIEEKWNNAVQWNTSIAFLMLDIDFFKEYNDTYGHLVGDDCLATIAAALEETSQKYGGLVARYGGEEFAVIFENISRDEAHMLADELRETIHQLKIPHLQSKINDYVTISVGVNYQSPQEDDNITSLVQRADQALYVAKELGKNQLYMKQEA